MDAHNKNALALAHWLEAHPRVERVLHPGLKSHPQHELALRQMTGYGGTFSFRVKGGEEEAFHVLGSVKLFALAESLGGVESLIEHPWSMTHASLPETVRESMGITRDMIRVSVASNTWTIRSRTLSRRWKEFDTPVKRGRLCTLISKRHSTKKIQLMSYEYKSVLIDLGVSFLDPFRKCFLVQARIVSESPVDSVNHEMKKIRFIGR